jgi:hypothetical protein
MRLATVKKMIALPPVGLLTQNSITTPADGKIGSTRSRRSFRFFLPTKPDACATRRNSNSQH